MDTPYVGFCSASLAGFPPIHLDHFILVDVFEDVRGVDEDANGSSRCHSKEHVQLQTIDHHRHVLPVFTNLKLLTQHASIDLFTRPTTTKTVIKTSQVLIKRWPSIWSRRFEGFPLLIDSRSVDQELVERSNLHWIRPRSSANDVR